MTISRPDAIGLFYDAAAGEAGWDDALDATRRHFDAAAVFLCMGNVAGGTCGQTWGANHDTAPFNAAGWRPDMNPAVRGGLIMPVGRSFQWQAIWPQLEDNTDDPFMRDTLFDQGCANNRTFVPLRDGGLLAGGFVALPDGRDVGAIGEELDRLVAHIGRALRLHVELGRHQSIEASLHGALDGLRVGVVVVDGDLQILRVNQLADTMLAKGDGLSASRGRLALASEAKARLRAALSAVAQIDAVDRTMTMSVSRPSGKAAYIVRAFPAIGIAHMGGCASAFATITIHDPASPPALPDLAQLRTAFGLTRAEAEVARLVPLAESKRTIADRLGVSENTIKTHISAIRQKAGVSNMVELGRVIERTSLSASSTEAAAVDR